MNAQLQAFSRQLCKATSCNSHNRPEAHHAQQVKDQITITIPENSVAHLEVAPMNKNVDKLTTKPRTELIAIATDAMGVN